VQLSALAKTQNSTLKKVHEAFVAIVGLKPLEGDLESPD
jgi:hypothetical protein